MENSTKALIIAAAVLIVIIIVALAINILSSSSNSKDSVDAVGDAMSVETDKVSKETLSILEDIQNKNLTKVSDLTITASNSYYQNYFPKNPKLILEPNTKYILSFEYEIIYADYPIGCGIGYGKTHYSKDILYSVTYPNQTKGKFTKTFTTPSTFITDEPYLQIRFARMNRPGSFKVEVSNIKFKKVK